MTEIAHILFELRERPGDWRISASGLTLMHKPSGLEIWLGSSPGNEGLYQPVQARFRWLDRCCFRQAIAGWREAERKRRIANAFDDAELERGRQPHMADAVE